MSCFRSRPPWGWWRWDFLGTQLVDGSTADGATRYRFSSAWSGDLRLSHGRSERVGRGPVALPSRYGRARALDVDRIWRPRLTCVRCWRVLLISPPGQVAPPPH